MGDRSTEKRVLDVIAEQLGEPKEKLAREISFVDDLSADSLDTVELIMELEEEFDVSIPEDEAKKIRTVGQAIDYFEGVAAKGTSSAT
jgi:acyl carrier protein